MKRNSLLLVPIACCSFGLGGCAIKNVGYISCAIVPAAARNENAQWELRGFPRDVDSGESLAAKPGSYRLSFKRLEGYKPMPRASIKILDDCTVRFVGHYERLESPHAPTIEQLKTTPGEPKTTR